jgi:hypothetical protein
VLLDAAGRLLAKGSTDLTSEEYQIAKTSSWPGWVSG